MPFLGTPVPSRPEEPRALTGIMLKLGSVFLFVVMQVCIKASGEVPAGQVVFFRTAFALVPIIVFLAWQRSLRTAFSTKRPFNHLLRGVVGIVGMGLSFFALIHLPLPEAITLNYAQPLLVVAMSAIFLGETVRIFRWSAVVIGLIGVVIVSWPNLTLFSSPAGIGRLEALGVVAALVAAFFSATVTLLITDLVRTERTTTIVMWFFLTGSIISLATWPFGWATLSAAQVFWLVSAGLFGGVGQLMMTDVYRYAPPSAVAPFEYTSLLLGIAAGYLFFGDIPTIYTLVGGTIVVACGLFIIWREHHLGTPRKVV
jgi:drug/metabolite transporter (DMT)-like permease